MTKETTAAPTWVFDPNKASKKQEKNAGKAGYEAKRTVLLAAFESKKAQIQLLAANEIEKVAHDDNAVNNIRAQESEFISDAKDEVNIQLAALAKDYNKTAETLDNSEDIGKAVMHKVATIKETRFGRFFKGAVDGFKEEFMSKK